jgi:hypothetical protein
MVSESGSYSDTTSSFQSNGVRIRGSFGQEKLFLAKWCPNQGPIRTRQALSSQMVSESGSYSDTKSSFQSNGVRIRGSFGHEKLFLTEWCPNQGPIRTRKALSSRMVSESGSYSDTTSSFQSNGVRSRGSFGHEKLFLAEWFPNHRVIRTRKPPF